MNNILTEPLQLNIKSSILIDDVFYDDTVLNDVFLCLDKSNKPNVLYTDILWEYKDYDKIRTTVLTANDLMCLHGLFVKTSWLRKIRILHQS